MKKKVLFMIDSLACGGAEKSIVSLLPLLDYDKLDVTLMLVGRGGVFERYVPEQVDVISYTTGCVTLPQKIWLRICRLAFSAMLRLNMLQSIIFRRKPLNPPVLEWMTCSTAIQPLKKRHYDVAIAYQQGFPCWYIMDKVDADKKYAWINVDITKTKYRQSYIKPFYDKYDGVVAVSDALYSIIVKAGLVDEKRLHCIYDIVSPEVIRRQAKERIEWQKLDGDVATIVTVARLIASNKGQDLCLQAAKILKDKGVKFHWVFVGGGPDKHKLEQMAHDLGVENNVEFVGMQPNPYPFIKAADVYVQSSRFEGFGLTITEAKILGKAIVCTDFPTAHNQITDGENGLIVDIAPEAIVAGIERLLNDKALAEKFQAIVAAEKNTTAQTESAKVMSLIMQ